MKKKTLCFLSAAMIIVLLFSSCGKTNYYDAQNANVINTTQAPVIELSKTAISIEVGESYKLTYDVKNDTEEGIQLYIMSADKSIATVDTSAKIVGVAPGKTNIIVCNKDRSITAVCEVTVTEIKKAIISSNTPESSKAGATYKIAVRFENCSDPFVKIVTNCAGGSVLGSNGTVKFGSGEQQFKVEGSVTIYFGISADANPNTIRVLCYDGDKQIDTKEFSITVE